MKSEIEDRIWYLFDKWNEKHRGKYYLLSFWVQRRKMWQIGERCDMLSRIPKFVGDIQLYSGYTISDLHCLLLGKDSLDMVNKNKENNSMKDKRNWSAYIDYEGGLFGQRLYYTREDWIQQCLDWFPDKDEEEYRAYLNKLDDEELMVYIQEMWAIEIRETSWLKEGNKCYWRAPEGGASGVYEILAIAFKEDDIGEPYLTKDTVILLGNGVSEGKATFDEVYGLTDKKCKKCGRDVYVSDLCSYPYVCLECDENFYGIEVV